MTAHIVLSAIDPSQPATLCGPVLNILRSQADFEGVIISDSLMMRGITKFCPSIEEAAICAFNAGCDLLLLGGSQLIEGDIRFELTVADIERIHRAVVLAVIEGRISQQRLDASVARILTMKQFFLGCNVF